MKPLFALLLSFLWLGIPHAIAQDQLRADIRVFTFETVEGENLAELYIGVLNSSIQVSDNQDIKGVEIKLIVRSGNEMVLADKYTLTQNKLITKDFFHIQRIKLKPGTYTFHVELKDITDANRTFNKDVTAEFKKPQNEASISSIQILGHIEKDENESNQSKNGYIMEPLKFLYLNQQYRKFNVYLETYNTDQLDTDHYLIRYDIVHQAGDTVLTRYKKRQNAPLDPILLTELNDTSWSSGQYTFHLALLELDQNKIASKATKFILSNPREKEEFVEQAGPSFASELTDEELNYALRALAPKVNPLDVERLNHMIAEGTRSARESFLHQFWALYHPINPKSGYEEYMEVVQALDNMYYDGLGHGFESDRGYIYLKYGQPNQQIVVEDEPTAPPYEIWFYDYFPATKQSNVKFVFYNPASTTFELLHSNARGEINDPQWLIKLYRNSPEDVIGNSIDAREVKDYWNRRAAEIYNDN